MFLEILGVLNLAALAAVAWRVRRVGQTLSGQIEFSALETQTTVANEAERLDYKNYWLHRLSRLYIGHEILEKRVCPALGVKTDIREKFEQTVDDGLKRLADKQREGQRMKSIDCGSFDNG